MRTQLTSSDDIVAPVDVAQLKSHARIDHSESDSELDIILGAVTERVEDVTRVAMVKRTFVQTIYGLLNRRVELSRAPVISITSVTDGSDTLVKGEDEDYVLKGDHLYLASLPDDTLMVTYEAGLAETAADVPPSLREQVLRFAATVYELPTTSAVDVSITKVPDPVRNGLIQYMRIRA